MSPSNNLKPKDFIPGAGSDNGAYADLKTRVSERLDEGRKMTSSKIDDAVDYAVSSATTASDYTREQISTAAERVRGELKGASDRVTGSVAQTGANIREKVPPRPKSRFLITASAVMGVGAFLMGRLSTRPRPEDIFKRGETVDSGLYRCTQCGTRIQLVSEARLPACDNCKAETFAKAR